MPAGLHPERCYRIFATHDRRFDGRIFAGVVTTGVYCRPVCRVRLPKARNCRFFACAAAAEAAGFRACLRCRPEPAPGTPAWLGTSATVSRALRQQIEQGALDEATEDELAARLGVTARHLRRLFAEHLGRRTGPWHFPPPPRDGSEAASFSWRSRSCARADGDRSILRLRRLGLRVLTKMTKIPPMARISEEIGVGQAKAHLSHLLERVRLEGAIVTITRHGRPVAHLVPVDFVGRGEHLADARGWLEDDDSFFEEIERVVRLRHRHRPRGLVGT